MTKNTSKNGLSWLYWQNNVSFYHFTQIRCIPIQILIIQRFSDIELGLPVPVLTSNYITYRSNHTLNLIITRLDERFVATLSIHYPFISDHFTVHCNLNIQRLPNPKTIVAYRKLCAINSDDLRHDILGSPLCLRDQPACDITALCDQYEKVIYSSW